MWIRALAVWLLLAVVEALQGYLRVRWVNPRVGDRVARRLGVVTGSLLGALIAWLALPWIGPANARESLHVGLLWLGLMLLFDFGVGRLVFKVSWQRIGSEFHLGRGGWLGVGMLAVLFAPLLAGWLRGWW